MPRAISLEEFEIRKNKKFQQFKTISYTNIESQYTFFCPIHKEQTICSARTFLNSKCGCSECFRETRQIDQRKVKWTKYSNKELEKKLLSLHKNYIFYFPNFNIGTHGVLEVLCQKHNFTFTNSVSNLLNGEGCRLCANERHNETLTKSKEAFLSDCISKFGDMYDYDLTDYINGLSYITITCKKCSTSRTIIAKSFLSGKGICPVCDESEGEFLTRRILQERNIKFIQHYTGFKDCRYKSTLEFDFYLPELNTVIEYQGSQHYIDNGWKEGTEFEEQQVRDQIKREYCKVNNIKEIEIPFWEKSNISKLI
jgi:hypothetical protein